MYSYKFNKLILIIFLIFFCLGFSLKPITTKGKWLNTLLLKKEFKTIILESDKFLISEPNNLEIRIILAMAYQLTGQIDEAMNQAKIILDKDETNIPANEIFMFSLMEKKHFEEGLAFAKKILQTDPNNAEAYYLFGWYNYEKGDEKNLKEAIEYFTKAGELDPKKELMTTDNIISIHMILHEFEKAEILAKKIYPKFSDKKFLEESGPGHAKESMLDITYVISISYARENNAKESLNLLRQIIEVDNTYKARAKRNRDLFQEVGKSQEFEELIK